MNCTKYEPMELSFLCKNCHQLGSKHQCVWDGIAEMFKRAGVTK